MTRVLIACSGLDHARRGFETFARECFEELRDVRDLEVELVKGSGTRGPHERPIPTLRRDRHMARALGRLLGARPFRVEALAFGVALTPLVVRRRPDVVFLSEWDTAGALAWARSLTAARFKLLLSNGSMAWRDFDHLDCVQQLTPAAYEYVMARGGDPARHVMLPLGFRIPSDLPPLLGPERAALRARLGLPAERRILLSVAALNRSHKRLDYVIDEIASLPAPRPFLLLLGQPDEETPGLLSLARDRLGEDGHAVRTVPASAVAEFCRAADAFILASLYEGLPRALIEASALGLPCLVHAYPVTEFALGPHALSADLTQPGGLAELISRLTEADLDPARARARQAYAYEQFSWDRLRPRYVSLLRDLARGAAGAPPLLQRPGPAKPWRA